MKNINIIILPRYQACFQSYSEQSVMKAWLILLKQDVGRSNHV